MQELTDFLHKLSKSDSVLLTELESRAYCRFFRDGQYLDRIFVTNPDLLEELLPLVGETYEIDASGIAYLKQHLLAADTQPAVDTL